MLFFPREVGARWPVLSSVSQSVSESVTAPPKPTEITEISGFCEFRCSFWPVARPARSGQPGTRFLGGPWPGAGGAWPGPRREPAARGHHDDCIPGSWRPKKTRRNDHASSNSDLESGVIPILLGYFLKFPVQDWHPVQAQDHSRARAQPGLRRGRAWDRATAEHSSS
eukprot:gene10143-biopygen6262